MRLADDDIVITLNGELLTLRPTLRAAFRLERKHGGFAKLAQSITEGNVTVACAVIGEAGAMSAAHVMAALASETQTFGALLMPIAAQLIRFVSILAGSDSTADAKASRSTSMPFEEYHTRLYRIATGWLGWTPKEALDATAIEITEALHGRADMLKAIFGSPDDADKSSPQQQSGPIVHTEEEVRDGRAKLKALARTGQNRSR